MRILVVDDEAVQEEMLVEALQAEGHEAVGFTDPLEAFKAVQAGGVDLLITDHRMPGMTGLELIEKCLETDPHLQTVIITAYGNVTEAVAAMKKGAFDYLTKPVDLDHLMVLVAKSDKQRRLTRENQALKDSLREHTRMEGFVGGCVQMQDVFSRIYRVAPTDATVLILGESGTGKELAARAIHHHSPRKDAPFVPVSCAAFPETLLESELFGHEKGAFTGAAHRRTGKFEAAHTGTLFLDEIGEVPLSVQVKLLRFLQDRTFERLGSNTPVRVDVRLVAATNRDLEAAVAAKAFREDLYYRLNVVLIRIPPLRERRAELPRLMDFFMKEYARKHGKNIHRYSQEVHDVLVRHGYPGNVRELENIMENAVVMCRGDTLTREDLPVYLAPAPGTPDPQTLPLLLERVEKELIGQALEAAGHVQTRAAERLGISERVLRYKIRKLGLRSSE